MFVGTSYEVIVVAKTFHLHKATIHSLLRKLSFVQLSSGQAGLFCRVFSTAHTVCHLHFYRTSSTQFVTVCHLQFYQTSPTQFVTYIFNHTSPTQFVTVCHLQFYQTSPTQFVTYIFNHTSSTQFVTVCHLQFYQTSPTQFVTYIFNHTSSTQFVTYNFTTLHRHSLSPTILPHFTDTVCHLHFYHTSSTQFVTVCHLQFYHTSPRQFVTLIFTTLQWFRDDCVTCYGKIY